MRLVSIPRWHRPMLGPHSWNMPTGFGVARHSHCMPCRISACAVMFVAYNQMSQALSTNGSTLFSGSSKGDLLQWNTDALLSLDGAPPKVGKDRAAVVERKMSNIGSLLSFLFLSVFLTRSILAICQIACEWLATRSSASVLTGVSSCFTRQMQRCGFFATDFVSTVAHGNAAAAGQVIKRCVVI